MHSWIVLKNKFKIVFKTIQLCIRWWKNFDNCDNVLRLILYIFLKRGGKNRIFITNGCVVIIPDLKCAISVTVFIKTQHQKVYEQNIEQVALTFKNRASYI